MKAISKGVLLLSGCLLTLAVFANNDQTLPLFTSTANPQLPKHTHTASEHSALDIETLAKHWHLSVSDYVRYTEIMQGPLGRWNPHIDPVLALGIYAESAADQQRYAEHYAQQEYELTQRTLAFQRAYRQAFNRLYPDIPILEPQGLQTYHRHQQQKQQQNLKKVLSSPGLQTGDRLLYFPALTCEHCGKSVTQWLKTLQGVNDSGIDIYVAAAQADQVQEWAKRNGIKRKWVTAGTVTLNVDKGLSVALAKQYPGRSTSLYLSRGEAIFALKPGELGL